MRPVPSRIERTPNEHDKHSGIGSGRREHIMPPCRRQREDREREAQCQNAEQDQTPMITLPEVEADNCADKPSYNHTDAYPCYGFVQGFVLGEVDHAGRCVLRVA